jgi:hypothetical protein
VVGERDVVDAVEFLLGEFERNRLHIEVVLVHIGNSPQSGHK